jgi:glutamine synthetase
MTETTIEINRKIAEAMGKDHGFLNGRFVIYENYPGTRQPVYFDPDHDLKQAMDAYKEITPRGYQYNLYFDGEDTYHLFDGDQVDIQQVPSGSSKEPAEAVSAALVKWLEENKA